jgi:hypothetical protein
MLRFLFIVYVVVFGSNQLMAESKDSTMSVKGTFTFTNNGFAIVPAFSLGKPAFLFDLAIANKRFSFEPQFRYSVNGKPWIFNFNFRYKLLNKGRTYLTIGGYLPALNFVDRVIVVNGVAKEIQTVRRFVSGELIINHRITKNSYAGIYYLQGHGFQSDGPRNIYYLALRASFQKIKLYKAFYAEFNPQLYYLTVNGDRGVYVNETILIGIKNFPLSISSTINKAIHSAIPAQDFDWNVSVNYSITQNYSVNNQ